MTLTSSLLGGSIVSLDTQNALFERCGGNPLYARQFARMLAESRIADTRDAADALEPEGTIPVPDTIQALISARLDLLSPIQKSLLQDAAVVGKVFWPGALAYMQGIGSAEVEWHLHELGRKELARRTPESSIAGQAEYAFHHVLIRDVAYRQIPKSERIKRHQAVAEWIEANSPERAIDHAEILAHHYAEALELAQASGSESEVQALIGPTTRFLTMAGERTLHLDVRTAERYWRRAQELLPASEAGGQLQMKIAGAKHLGGRVIEAEGAYKQAIEELRSRNDQLGLGEAMVGLADVLWGGGAFSEAASLLPKAIAILEAEPPSHGLVLGYLLAARQHWRPGQYDQGLQWAEKGLALARALAIDELIVRGLAYVGEARLQLGETAEGLRELRESLRLGIAFGIGMETARAYNNLGAWVGQLVGPRQGLAVRREGVRFAEERGLTAIGTLLRAFSLGFLYEIGSWDELLAEAQAIIATTSGEEGPREVMNALSMKADVLLRRGNVAEATSLKVRLLPLAEAVTEWDTSGTVIALGVAAAIDQAIGNEDSARQLIEEISRLTQEDPNGRVDALPIAVAILTSAHSTEAARAFLVGVNARTPIDDWALSFSLGIMAEAEGQILDAATHYEEAVLVLTRFDNVPDRAEALLGWGRCLYVLGSGVEASEKLLAALKLFVQIGARPHIVEAEHWLELARAS